MKPFYSSKKFWALISGISILIGEYFGVDEELTFKAVGLVSAYMIGQGIADSGKK